MEFMNRLVTHHASDYFRNLPVPASVRGCTELKSSEWMKLLAFGGAVGFVGYLAARGLFTMLPEAVQDKLPNRLRRGKLFWMNKDIEKEKKKCKHVIDIEDIGKKASLCRCWKSKTFPYCDGAHGPYNRMTGDNVGPVNVVRKKLQ